MKSVKILSRILITGAMCAGPVVAQPQTDKLSETFTGKPVPKYSRGVLLARDPAESCVYLVRPGQQSQRIQLKLPEDGTYYVRDATLSPKGTLVTVGTVKSATNTSGALVIVVPNTGETKVVLTDHFGTALVAVTDNSEIVVAGREYDSTFRDIPGASILRIYTEDGVLVKKLLPREMVLGEGKILSITESSLAYGNGNVALVNPSTNNIVFLDHSWQIKPVFKLPTSVAELRISNCAIQDSSLYCSLAELRGEGPPRKPASSVVAMRIGDQRLFDLSKVLQLDDSDIPVFAGIASGKIVIRKQAHGSLVRYDVPDPGSGNEIK
ncbi:hypothetical protein [Bryobacter aggregatus]|uniref:hypothetical protein n=1 Tax=Bryobacter aggregatus TaxID=360054 RepID=UPI0004E1E11C|nr:hypothetical protein [Bryobacter aggregatus]